MRIWIEPTSSAQVKQGSLESTRKKTLESTEQAWNKNVKIAGRLKKTTTSHVLVAADAKRASGRETENGDARIRWKRQ